MNSFNQKLNILPKNVQEFFVSMKAAELNSLICKENNILEKKSSTYLNIINKLFFKELEIVNLEKEIMQSFSCSEEESKKITEQIIGIRLLVVDDWFGGEASKYLENNKIKISDYQKYIKDQQKAIQEEKIFFENELKDDFQEYIPPTPKEEEIKPHVYNPEKEKEDSKEIFSGMLSCFLADHVNPFLEDYNHNLIILFNEDKTFKTELEHLLFVNGEMLTHQPFEIDGRYQSPTIGNWIQDFIRYQGSGMFSNLALTKYITDSENARRLPPAEKKLVQRLLQLYRNLKFFPESLSDVPVEDWEIIPTNKEGANSEPRKPIGLPKTEEEKKIEELRREEEEFSAGGLERLAIEEEIRGKKKLEDLKIEMNKYAEGSLERMVVEEEIRKLGT